MFEKLLKKEVQVAQAPPKEEALFKLNLQQEIPSLPDFKTKEETDIRYPLMEPYAYVHIHWDPKSDEVLYEVEEPQLDKREKDILRILEDGVKELINISFISIKEGDVVIRYLEKNINILLIELGLSLSKETFLKVMYYIYRDFVGLNEIEPLMNDYFIEDIECNGINSPIYIVHRKYRNLKTNITFTDIPYLASFVEKLAQKCGRYVSYSSPLLDGSLPSGHRVNATYTTDISSKGPTITIRAFTKEPWSPSKMIDLGTVSPEILAYLWMLVEHEFNVMVIGGTGSGKTSFLNALAFFIPQQARIVSIEDSVTGDSRIIIKEGDKIKNITIKEFVDNKIKAEVLTLTNKGKIVFVKPSNYIKHKIKKDIYEVTTATGRRIKVTKDHSLFVMGENGLKEEKPIDLKENESFIAVPRILPIDNQPIEEINLIHHLNHFKEFFLVGEPIKKVFKKYTLKDLKIGKSKYQWRKNNNLIKIEDFLKLDIKFSKEELLALKIKTKNKASIPIIFKITPEFLQYCGLWLGDGSYDNHNKNVVIVSNADKECRDLIKRIARNLDSNYSIMTDKGVSIRIHNRIFYRFMKEIIGLEGYSNTKKIPEFVWSLSNQQIKSFINGYFSADGCVRKFEVSCTSQSYDLLEELQSLLLRQGIIARINKHIRKDKCIDMAISSLDNLEKFKEIGFLQERKNIKLNSFNKKATHSCSDIIPLTLPQLGRLNGLLNNRLQQNYKNQLANLGRDYLQKIAPEGSEFNDISHNDIFWDKVIKVRKVSSDEIEVFDLSIPGYEKFLCNNIFVHNTKELNIVHENWLPSVAREGIGLANIVGQKYGEVTLFDLLKESFRQRPDYVIIGEVRGKEAFVLFQGMASIDGNEKVLLLNEGRLKTMAIKDLENKNIKDYKAITLNPNTQKLEILPIKSFRKHPPRKILYHIITKSNKKILLTGDHSLFKDKDNIIPTECKSLIVGQKILSFNLKSNILSSVLFEDEIKSIKKIILNEPKNVYDLSVPGTRNFISESGILLHNSGHPSMGTMHANDVQTMIRRLETEPINLSPSLVESMDAICVMTQAKLNGKEVRRIKQVVEVISVPEDIGKAQVNIPFQWDPRTDTFFFKTDSYIFQKLTAEYGFTKEQLLQEFEYRTRLLYTLYQRSIFDFRKVQEIINEYARSPKKILKDYGIIK